MEAIAVNVPSTAHVSSVEKGTVATRPLASSGHASMKLEEGDKPAKPKQSKSRNGCTTCKAKRLKCDEAKPGCEQCRKRNVQCGGYSKAFKWRTFEEASFTAKNGVKSKKELSASTTIHPSEAAHISQPHARPDLGGELRPTTFQTNWQSPFPSSSHSSSRFSPPQFQYLAPQPTHRDGYSDGRPNPSAKVHPPEPQMSPLPPSFSLASRSPSLKDLLLPGTDLSSNYRAHPPPKSPTPYTPNQEPPSSELPETTESAWNPAHQQYFSTRHYDPKPQQVPNLWDRPRLAPGSQEMLVVQFDRYTCGILSVKDGPNENPWRTVIWPLAQQSTSLFHAVSSLTAFHSAKVTPQLRVNGMDHMHKSVQSLTTSLNRMKLESSTDRVTTETALATTLVLGFGEGWDQHISTGIRHLKGARYFVNQAVQRQRKVIRGGQRPDATEWRRLKFLCNTFVYMDVVARLTSPDAEEDDLGYLDNVMTTFNAPTDDLAEIDPLMGAASTLFPLIGRVAAMVTKVRKTTTNAFTLISDALELKKEIEQWPCPQPHNFQAPQDPTSEVQHSIQTAEAYRWATLLYLHQAVPEIPSESAPALADRVLKYLATVPLSSRTVIVQIYPLMTASCEAVSQEERLWIRNRWAAMSARLSIGNVDKCLEVIQEVWERRDMFEAEKAHNRFGQVQESSPTWTAGQGLKRRSTDIEAFRAAPADSSDLGGFHKRRAMTNLAGQPQSFRTTQALPPLASVLMKPSTGSDSMASEYTVRGCLHWIAVMSEHRWEGRARYDSRLAM